MSVDSYVSTIDSEQKNVPEKYNMHCTECFLSSCDTWALWDSAILCLIFLVCLAGIYPWRPDHWTARARALAL